MIKEHPLSTADLKKMLGAAESRSLRDFAILTIAAHHAIRCSEIAGEVRRTVKGRKAKVYTGLKTADVNLADNRIRITRLKGSVSKVELMSPAVKEVLSRWLLEKPESEWLFPGRDGGPLSRMETYRIFRRYAELAGVPAVSRSPHAFRHTLGQRAVDSGIPIDVLQLIMGHKSIGSTGSYYVHSQAKIDAARLTALAL